MNFLKQHIHKFPILILNISGFTIEAFVLDLDKKGESKIEIIERSDILSDNFESNANLEKNLENAIKKAINNAILFTAKKQKNGIKSCFLALSSPWYVSLSKIFKVEKEEPFFFDKNLIKEILNDENNLFAEKTENDKLKFLEAEIIKTKLNGYETKKPFDKKTKSAEIYFYISAAKKDFFNFINNILKREFHFDPSNFLTIKTLPSILFNFTKSKPAAFIQDKIPDKNFDGNGLFLFLMKENAELILIQENYIKETASINKGYNFFIRCLTARGKSFHEAESLFSKYQNNSLESMEKEKCGKIMEICEQEWKKSFNNLVERLTADYFLPQNLYLFSSKPVSKNIFLDDKSNFILTEPLLAELNNPANGYYKIFDETSSYLIVELLKDNLL